MIQGEKKNLLETVKLGTQCQQNHLLYYCYQEGDQGKTTPL